MYFVFLNLFIFIQSSFGQRDTIFINGMKFLTTRQTIKTEYDKKDTLLKLFALEKGKREFLFKHYLYRYGADAENEYKDIGTIQIQNDSIILKTHYFQKRSDPIPEWRMRIYKVRASGKLLLIFDKCKYKNSNKWTKTDFSQGDPDR